MIIFNHKYIKLFLLVFCSILLFISIIFFVKFYSNQNLNHNVKFNPSNVNSVDNYNIEALSGVNNWSLSIPAINLININIASGTTSDILLEYIGHFDTTPMYNGNIGLAAHNRGYKNNYFSNINKLKFGDKIIYSCAYGIKKYEVDIIEKIDSYDWSYLENTKENRITLITCVEDEPNLRLCVSGKEIKE